jgi:hypothetical protein
MRSTVTLFSFVLFLYLVKVGTFGGGFDYITGIKERTKGYNYLVKLDPRGLWVARSRSWLFGVTNAVPMGAMIGVAAIAPSIWLLRQSFSKQPRDGVCATCGYDLTGNVSGTCPERGTMSAPQKIST